MKRLLFFLWNLWPPFLGTGIRIVQISRDLMTVRVRLGHFPWTRNPVGSQFGGSIFAMTDPFFMAMLRVQLGPQFHVWDKAASIRFKRPGRSRLEAEFRLSPEDVAALREELIVQAKIDWSRDIVVTDATGAVVAEVHKTVHIRRADSR
jgi:acyl-coenzyme A thioesterase PaaI-like protein